jgi:hypothetical protein
VKFAHRLVFAAQLAALCTAARAEPPDLEALECTVAQQELGATLRLQVRFENHGASPLELPPGPHLIFYVDPAATQRLDLAARMDRIRRSPIVIPPGGSAVELFAVGKAPVASLQCGGARPVAAAMYFYRFSQQPQFRCRLRNFDVQAASGTPACAPAASP